MEEARAGSSQFVSAPATQAVELEGACLSRVWQQNTSLGRVIQSCSELFRIWLLAFRLVSRLQWQEPRSIMIRMSAFTERVQLKNIQCHCSLVGSRYKLESAWVFAQRVAVFQREVFWELLGVGCFSQIANMTWVLHTPSIRLLAQPSVEVTWMSRTLHERQNDTENDMCWIWAWVNAFHWLGWADDQGPVA